MHDTVRGLGPSPMREGLTVGGVESEAAIPRGHRKGLDAAVDVTEHAFDRRVVRSKHDLNEIR